MKILIIAIVAFVSFVVWLSFKLCEAFQRAEQDEENIWS